MVCVSVGLRIACLLSLATANPFENVQQYITMPNNADEPIHNSDLIETLRFSQQTPMILGQQPMSAKSPLSVTSSVRNQPEDYGLIEQLFFSCLQTGDDKSAAMCLERLTQFFGHSNEKVMGLRGLYQEATAVDRPALEKCLHEYDNILSQDPANLVCTHASIVLPTFPCGS